MWTMALIGALAAEPADLQLTGERRAADDVTVFVRGDGSLTWAGEPILDYDLAPLLQQAVSANPATRVVVQAERGTPYEALLRAIDLARESGAASVALVAPGLTEPVAEPPDPLFAPGEAEALDEETLSPSEQRELAPKRHKYPQNPYGNTASYTAYTLEPGEAKIGLGAVQVGVLPRFQVGTVPLLDLVGVFNGNARYDFLRAGPLDLGVLAQAYTVPLTNVLEAVGAGEFLTGDQGTTVTSRASWVGLGATASVRLAPPWTLHTQVYWASPSVKGAIAFDDLPEVLVPGLDLGGSAAVGLGVKADLAILNLATDLRFNRRDSVYAWLRYPFYGRVRGVTDGAIEGFEQLENAQFIVAYGDRIALADGYSLAVGYQASWRHLELRLGVGWSAVPNTWLLQAFELAYRFGGPTRRHEREVRQGYRDVKRETEAAPAPE
jgi:hypothetical protein